MSNPNFWKTYDEVDSLLKKEAFIQMPGGEQPATPPGDPAAGGMPPPGMDPAMMDPAMMGGAPMDPAAAGGMPPPGDPAMMGMDPTMMGGMPPAGDPAAAGAPEAAPGSPMITISLDQLFEIIQKVLGLAKKVGVNGSGVQSQPTPAPEAQGISQDQLKATIYEALGQMAG